jgi:hypothetical protein
MLALRRRIGVELAVDTSFNVAGPIAQTARQAIETLRRSKGMNAVVMLAEEGAVFAAWHRDAAWGVKRHGFDADRGNGRLKHGKPRPHCSHELRSCPWSTATAHCFMQAHPDQRRLLVDRLRPA